MRNLKTQRSLLKFFIGATVFGFATVCLNPSVVKADYPSSFESILPLQSILNFDARSLNDKLSFDLQKIFEGSGRMNSLIDSTEIENQKFVAKFVWQIVGRLPENSVLNQKLSNIKQIWSHHITADAQGLRDLLQRLTSELESARNCSASLSDALAKTKGNVIAAESLEQNLGGKCLKLSYKAKHTAQSVSSDLTVDLSLDPNQVNTNLAKRSLSALHQDQAGADFNINFLDSCTPAVRAESRSNGYEEPYVDINFKPSVLDLLKRFPEQPQNLDLIVLSTIAQGDNGLPLTFECRPVGLWEHPKINYDKATNTILSTYDQSTWGCGVSQWGIFSPYTCTNTEFSNVNPLDRIKSVIQARD